MKDKNDKGILTRFEQAHALKSRIAHTLESSQAANEHAEEAMRRGDEIMRRAEERLRQPQ